MEYEYVENPELYKTVFGDVDNSPGYKVSVISPNDDDYHLEDGRISFVGKVSDDVWHVDCLNHYGISTYGEDSIFGMFSDKVMANVPIYFLVEHFDNAVLLNLHDSGHSDKALLYLPADPSFAQMDSINVLVNSLKGFKIKVISSLTFEDGLVDDGPSVYVTSDGKIDLFENNYLGKNFQNIK